MSNQKLKLGGISAFMAFIVILASYALGFVIWQFVLGSSAHIDDKGHPHPGDIMGMMYKGGFIVPILIAIVVIIITFTVERTITLMKAVGKGNAADLIRKTKAALAGNQYDEAIAACDAHQSSLGNVIRAGVEKARQVQSDSSMDKETKVAAVQKAIEEATSLELPMLSKNLPVISTTATIATLWGLIGTVIGMIRSFAALSQAGAPDTTALATGISEALINTGLGIFGSVLGIVAYNFFSTKVDAITYSMDEAGFSIVQSVGEKA